MTRMHKTFAALLVLSGFGAGGASGPPTQDIGWPRQIAKNGARFVYYQPQIDDWKDYKQLFARVAFSLTPSGGQEVLGVVSLRADTLVDTDARTVFLRDIEVADVRFPSLDSNTAAQMAQLLRQLVPPGGETISLDRVMADLQHAKAPARPVEVQNDPPQIFYSTSPAVLLLVQGEPVLAPIEKTGLEFLGNANGDVFREKSSKRYFLLAEKSWLGPQNLVGPWTSASGHHKDVA